MRRCKTRWCRGNARSHSPFCGKCFWRRLKEVNPLKYSFWKLKHRARERGHSFLLTFDEYKEFSIQSGYAEWKGKTAESLSINRIDPEKGYQKDNIEAVTLSYNSRLQHAPIPKDVLAKLTAGKPLYE